METVTGNWMCFNLFKRVNYQKCLFAVVSLESGKYPVLKITYSGISLVSWLEWKGKTVKDIHMRQDMCGQTDKGGQTEGRDKRHTAGTLQIIKTHIRHHTYTHTYLSSPASCLSVSVLICRLCPAFYTTECLCEELWDEDIETYAWCLFRFIT